jgi:hypothetical protein
VWVIDPEGTEGNSVRFMILYLDQGVGLMTVLWQEGREWEDRFMSVTVEQRKTGVQEFCLETREGSPHPRGEKRQ